MPATVKVFDPALCCSTGVCGPTTDAALPRIAADLDWLRRQGVAIERWNLSQAPGAFVAEPLVRRALEEGGVERLPLVLVDGKILAQGAYPDRATLAAAVGVVLPATPPTRSLDVELLALDLETCDRCTGTDASLDAAIAEVADELRAGGLAVRVHKTVVSSLAQAEALGFSSSPTIRVDGRDIALERRESSCGACSDQAGTGVDCRVWVYEGREYTEAPRAMIADALRRAAREARPGTAAPSPRAEVPENLRRFFAGREAGASRASCCAPALEAPATSPCCAPAPGATTPSSGQPLSRSEKPRVSKGGCC